MEIARYRVMSASFISLRNIAELMSKGRQYRQNLTKDLLLFPMFRDHSDRADLIALKAIPNARISALEYFSCSSSGIIEGLALVPWAVDIMKIISKDEGDIVVKIYRNNLISHVMFTEGKQILMDSGRWMNRKSNTRTYPHFETDRTWGYKLVGSMT